jgi:U3 small nucleolar RNA-associated protein 12
VLEHQRSHARLGDKAPEAPVHIVFQAYGVKTAREYLLEVMKRVKSSELEEALLVLPLSYVTTLLSVLNACVERGWETELCSRALLYLLRIHRGQITSSHTLLPVIDSLRHNIHSQTSLLKDRVGFNLAGLRFLQQQLEEKTSVLLFADASTTQRHKKRRRAVLTLRT